MISSHRMSASVRRVVSLIIVSLIATSSAFATGERNSFDPTQFSTGNFHGCPPTGQGSDPYLNSLKNRDQPPTGGKIYTVAKLYRVTPRLPNRKIHREKWTAAQQDLAAIWEQRSVMVEGYLIDAVKEGREACNCGDDTYVDHHLWLAGTPSASKARALVVEVSPRSWPTHPTWSDNATFRKLVRDKAKVRVAGWLTWDQEHQANVGGSRMTLWEVHPIHSIQVWRNNQWVTI